MDRSDTGDSLLLASSSSGFLPRVARGGGETAVLAGPTVRWHRQRTSISRQKRRSAARLVLASIPGTSGMFASQDSVLLPLQALSDTVRPSYPSVVHVQGVLELSEACQSCSPVLEGDVRRYSPQTW